MAKEVAAQLRIQTFRKLFFITYFFAKLNTRFQFSPRFPHVNKVYIRHVSLHLPQKLACTGIMDFLRRYLQIFLTLLVSGKSTFPPQLTKIVQEPGLALFLEGNPIDSFK